MVIVESYFFYDLYDTGSVFNGKTYSKIRYAFIKNNRHHRYYGPSVIFNNNKKEYVSYIEDSKMWFFKNNFFGEKNKTNKKYSQKQFIKDLNKKWLL